MENKKRRINVFSVGIVLAILEGILAGIGMMEPFVVPMLVMLGLMFGFLNVTQKETVNFLVAAIALMVAGATVGLIISSIPPMELEWLTVAVLRGISGISGSIAIFIAPAAVIVALHDIYALAKD